jgi:hypothetical protein
MKGFFKAIKFVKFLIKVKNEMIKIQRIFVYIKKKNQTNKCMRRDFYS